MSLTLVPMLASRLLPAHEGAARRRPRPRARRGKSFIGRHFERGFTKVRNGYEKTLDLALRIRFVVLMIAFGTFALTVLLFTTIPKGFFPEEDIGQLRVSTEAAEDISFERHDGAACAGRRRDPGRPGACSDDDLVHGGGGREQRPHVRRC